MARPSFSPTATTWDMLVEVWRYVSPAELHDIPLIVVGEDGNSRPVVAIDFVEEGDADEITARACVLRTGSHSDPHPMWVEGETFEALAVHEREGSAL